MLDTTEGMRELARLRRRTTLLEGMLEAKTRELSAINCELEQRVEERTAELRAALAAANAAGEAKRSFLSHVSHELRTPLQAIDGMAEVIAATTTERVTRERIGVVRSSGAHMLSLVEQLLDLSWLDRDQMPLDLRATAVTGLVGDVVALLGVKAAQKRLTLDSDIGELPEALLVDDLRLREVLINFAGNAIKFTTEGSVRIAVQARRDGDVCDLAWTVTDTGCGMDEATLQNVFEPFFQARDTYRREHGGAGLGMAIARRLVQAMGGEVCVESAPGRGTTVRFNTRHAFAAPGVVPAASSPTTGRGERLLPGVRVLVVDDQRTNCRVAEAVVELLGGHAETITDPELAGARATAGFDVLIIDYHMPKLDGCELLRRLRAAGLQTPALLATADATHATRAAAAAVGFDAVLLKPFDVQGARTAIAQVLGPSARSAGGPATPPVNAAPGPESAGPALFAVDATIARLGGHARILRACVEAYLDSVPGVLQQLQRGEQVSRSAHALKGSAADIGAEQLAECARRVESGDLTPLDNGELFALAEHTEAELTRWLDGR